MLQIHQGRISCKTENLFTVSIREVPALLDSPLVATDSGIVIPGVLINHDRRILKREGRLYKGFRYFVLIIKLEANVKCNCGPHSLSSSS